MLEHLQERFINSLYSDNIDFLKDIKASHTISAQQSLNIYQESVYANLIQALSQIYPVVESLVGAEFFDLMASDFISNNPPEKDRLDQYGDSLPLFISTYPRLEALPYLSDMAKLEWAVHEVFHEKDRDLTQNLPLISQESQDPLLLQTSCIPALRSITVYYEVDLLMQMHWQNKWQDLILNKLTYPIHLITWRPNQTIFLDRFDESLSKILTAIKTPQMLWKVADKYSGFEERLPELFQKEQIILSSLK